MLHWTRCAANQRQLLGGNGIVQSVTFVLWWKYTASILWICSSSSLVLVAQCVDCTQLSVQFMLKILLHKNNQLTLSWSRSWLRDRGARNCSRSRIDFLSTSSRNSPVYFLCGFVAESLILLSARLNTPDVSSSSLNYVFYCSGNGEKEEVHFSIVLVFIVWQW